MTMNTLVKSFVAGKTMGKAGNIFIDGDKIYSYGYHYVAGHRIVIAGQTIILVNSTYYSQSTENQCWLIYLRAEESNLPVIRIPDCKLENMQPDVYTRIKKLRERIMRARSLGPYYMYEYRALEEKWNMAYKTLRLRPWKKIAKLFDLEDPINQEIKVQMVALKLKYGREKLYG